MWRKISIFWVFIFGLVFFQDTQASHLMGGNIGYDYIGTLPNGMKRYKVYLYIYRDCLNGQSDFDNPLPLAIFDARTQKCVKTISVPFLQSNKKNVTPNLTSNCPPNTLPSYCIEQGYYETVVDLDTNTAGYHLVYERCCRNDAIVNINRGQGQRYLATIPSTNLNNSSPSFSDVPVPFMCVNDTAILNNSAVDKNGDSLVYTFAWPYAGADTNNPTPSWMVGDLYVPPTLIAYKPGYSFPGPFGTNGYTMVDPASGITYYYSTSTGNYIVAIEILEYRKGVLISKTRRDIQILAGNCPANSKPTLANTPPTGGQTVGSGVRTITVEEGTLVNFPITIKDNDSVYLSVTGVLANPSVNGIATPYPVLSLVRGIGIINGNFSWQTTCAHRRTAPYEFTIAAQDQGCPKMTSYFNYKITVIKSTTATKIIPPKFLCEQKTDTFTINGSDSSTYTWVVTGATILSGQGTTKIAVQFPSGSNSINVKVIEKTKVGCFGDTIRGNYTVNENPVGMAVANPNPACPGNWVVLQALGVNPSVKYSWLPSTGLTAPFDPTTAIKVDNNTLNSKIYRFSLYVRDTLTGCIDSGFLNFSVNPQLDIDAGKDTSICPDQFYTLGNNLNNSISYIWHEILPFGNSTVSNQANPRLYFTNVSTSSITKTFEVVGKRAADNCERRDTVKITIYPRAIANAGQDLELCNNKPGVIGTNAISGQTYYWTPSFGLDDSLKARPTVIINNPLNAPITFPYYLVANKNGCTTVDTVLVKIRNTPTPPQITGNLNPCKNSKNQVYRLTPRTGSTYQWKVINGSIVTSTNTSLMVNWGNLDTGYIVITETDSFGCLGNPDSIFININRAKIDSLFGNNSVCPFIQGVQYWVNLDTGSTYQWSSIGGTLAKGQGTDTISINWGGPGLGSVTVIPTNKYGCVGDSVSKSIVKNNLLITIPPVGDTDVCVGEDSVLYSVIPTTGSTFTWTVTNGVIVKGQGTANILVNWMNFIGQGTVTVIEKSSFPCEGAPVSTHINIQPNPIPQPIIGPDTLCQKFGGVFSTTGTPNAQFIWWGTNIDSNTILPRGSSTVQALWKWFGNQEIKVLEITQYGCSTDTSRKTVYIEPEPFISLQKDVTVCSGMPISMGQVPQPNRSYSWHPGLYFQDSTSATAIFTSKNLHKTTDTIIIYRDVTNTQTGCISYDTLMVYVRPQPIVFAGNDTAFCSDFILPLGTFPFNGYKYLWTPNFGISNDTISNPLLNLSNLSDTLEIFQYKLKAIEPTFGCYWTDTIVIGLKPLPKANVLHDAEPCSNDTLTLGSENRKDYQYVWTPNTYINNDRIGNPLYQRNNPTQIHFFDTLYLTTTNIPYGCVSYDTSYLKVKPKPIVSAGVDQTLCSEDTVTIGGKTKDPNYSYQWSPLAGVFQDTMPQTRVTVINKSLSNQIYPYILTATFTKYQCKATDTVFLLVHPEPNTDTLIGPKTICEYDSNVIYKLPLKNGSNYLFVVQGGTLVGQIPGGQGWIINWGNSGVGTISYRETDSNGCVGKWRVANILISTRPAPLKILGDSIVCSSKQFNAVYQVQSYLPTSTFQWFIDGGTIKSGGRSPVVTVDWDGINTRRIGYLEINKNGCSGDTLWQNVYFDSLTIEINRITTLENQPNTFELSWKITSPINLFSGQFNIYYRPIGGNWTILGGVPANTYFYQFSHLPTDQRFDFKVEGLNHCNQLAAASIHRNVVLSAIPNKNIDVTWSWTPYLGWPKGVGSYELLKTKNDILTPSSSYFGSDTAQKIEITLDEYKICMRIKSTENIVNGNTSLSNQLCFELDPVLNMPNAFSPGDLNGLNDAFKAVGSAIKEFNMEIYNRWGERIYTSNDINQGWDGTYKGEKAITGMYVYLVTYTSGKGKVHQIKGSISLIR